MKDKLTASAQASMPEHALKFVSAAPPAQVAAAFSEVVKAHHEFRVIREQEVTKREGIAAWANVEIERIQSQKMLLKQYLECSFQERKGVFSEAFRTLDIALEQLRSSPDNPAAATAVDAALGIIVTTVKQSPLEGINSLFAAMEGPDGVINV